MKEFKAFQRVNLKPGKKKPVLIEVPYERLALVNQDLETVVEPGRFEVMIGNSSRDQDMPKDRFEIGEE